MSQEISPSLYDKQRSRLNARELRTVDPNEIIVTEADREILSHSKAGGQKLRNLKAYVEGFPNAELMQAGFTIDAEGHMTLDELTIPDNSPALVDRLNSILSADPIASNSLSPSQINALLGGVPKPGRRR